MAMAARRVDVVVFTDAGDKTTGLGDQLAAALRPWGFVGPGFVSRTAADRLERLIDSPLRLG